MFPDKWLKRFIIFIGRTFTHKSEEERALFESMVWNSNAGFIRWGIHQTLNWRQEASPANLLHIHGSKDRLFPIRKIKADFVIPEGEHFIIVQRASEVSDLLNKIIN